MQVKQKKLHGNDVKELYHETNYRSYGTKFAQAKEKLARKECNGMVPWSKLPLAAEQNFIQTEQKFQKKIDLICLVLNRIVSPV